MTTKLAAISLHRSPKRESSRRGGGREGRRSTYVPGTAALIQGAAGAGSSAGGCEVVSWTPVSATSVERAASQPVSSSCFPTATAISTITSGEVSGFPIPGVRSSRVE